MTIDLHCFGESGNSYKAALALEMSGLDWRPVHVDFFRGAARQPDFATLNVMAEAPVMVDGDYTLTQSGAIQDYVVEKTGRFGGVDSTERREIWRWVLFDNHKLSGVAGTVRFLSNFLAEEKRNPDVIAFLTARLQGTLNVLERHLEGRDWIVGDAITVADMSCCGYLYYPEPFGFDRATHPNIDAWLDRIAAQPGWKHPYDLMARAFPGA